SRYQISEGHGLFYSYCVYDSFDLVESWADRLFILPEWFDSLAELVSSVAHRRGSDSGGHTRSRGGRENGLVFGAFEHNPSCRLQPGFQRLLGNLGGGLLDQPHISSGIKGGVSSRGCALVSLLARNVEVGSLHTSPCSLDLYI